MNSNDDSADARGTAEPDATHGRRTFVQLSAGAVAVGIAGCSDLGLGTDDEDDPEDTTDGGTDEPTGDGTPTETAADEGASTETESDDDDHDHDHDDGDGEEDETADEGDEADGDLHEHGLLYLEVDGDRHSFDDPKYYEEGTHEDGQAGRPFHFHPDGNDQYWHMHDVRLTLAEALEELPDVDYERDAGRHAVHFEGDSYVDGVDDTEIEIRQRDVPIDPEEYELHDGDIIWIEIFTDGRSDDE